MDCYEIESRRSPQKMRVTAASSYLRPTSHRPLQAQPTSTGFPPLRFSQPLPSFSRRLRDNHKILPVVSPILGGVRTMEKPLLGNGNVAGGGKSNGSTKGYGSSNGRGRGSTLGGSFASCRGSTDEALLGTTKDGTLLPLTSPLKGNADSAEEDETCCGIICSFLYDMRWHFVTLVIIVACFLIAHFVYQVTMRDLAVYGTIPLISMAFAFGHIWLALQMVSVR